LNLKHYIVRNLNNSSANLIKLMDNDSFIRWLTGSGSKSEIEEWEQWIRLDDNHAFLVRQAQRILNLPFLEHECPNIELELLRLQHALSEKT
jgi:hypothetical protein